MALVFLIAFGVYQYWPSISPWLSWLAVDDVPVTAAAAGGAAGAGMGYGDNGAAAMDHAEQVMEALDAAATGADVDVGEFEMDLADAVMM